MSITIHLPFRWVLLGGLLMVSALFTEAYSAGTVSELRARHNERAFDLRMEQQRFRHRLQSDRLPLAKQRGLNLRLQQQGIRQRDLQRQQILEQNLLRQQQGHRLDPTRRGGPELRQRFRREHQEQQFQFKQERRGLMLRQPSLDSQTPLK
ncbi:hypothetical protein Nhal_2253 [Nitrosococcus halophilus Nc 4]|uniref:Uncharacterized protein n=1 Tax=Nitrosococcus halophilus (strain Nc4) TaxID=472759 RepID=D5BUZ4_NITHN|nr:hypothetical protein [Nitrosococcus halophilus]ADE15344.1 hypothetical protein Nhal_2253 [Nitrosococcus halophilus Nc 4]